MVRSIGADTRLRRREFLRLLPAGATFLASLPACGRRGIEALTPLQLQRISKDLLVIRGAVNTSLLTKDGAVLAIGGDPRPDPPSVERVLFTHHRRDVVWAGAILAQRGAALTIPETERRYFADTAAPPCAAGRTAATRVSIDCRRGLPGLRVPTVGRGASSGGAGVSRLRSDQARRGVDPCAIVDSARERRSIRCGGLVHGCPQERGGVYLSSTMNSFGC